MEWAAPSCAFRPCKHVHAHAQARGAVDLRGACAHTYLRIPEIDTNGTSLVTCLLQPVRIAVVWSIVEVCQHQRR